MDFLLNVFEENAAEQMLIWRDRRFSYRWLLDAIEEWDDRLARQGVGPGNVVSLETDFGPGAVAAFLALVRLGCIVVPLTASVESRKAEYRRIAEVEWTVGVDGTCIGEVRRLNARAEHELIAVLRRRAHPGLVLFSSGSTGAPKASLHDLNPLLDKFRMRKRRLRTMAFLLFDHIGGLNTLLYTLSNAGCMVITEDRTPDAVCALIERHRVQLLPTSPTFLRLLLMSEAYRRFDLSSLELITYGTEVMPESTLRRLHAVLPAVALQQTYGLSELGILRSKSEAPDSLFVRIGGEGFETRVRDGLLEIRASSAMLGYLNAPSPFTEDGWFMTKDAVEERNGFYRVLGRVSDVINVGGEKVYPGEVEGVVAELDGVEECAVKGEKNALLGNLVSVTVKLAREESESAFKKRMWDFCKNRLERFKIPQKVHITEKSLHGERFKKVR